MRAVVVQTHPVGDSFSAALGQAAHAAVRAQHPDAQLHRVCQQGPVTRETLSDVEHLVMVQPTWWGSLPAQLIANLHDLLDTPGAFGSVDRLSVVTTHGGSKLVNVLQGEPGRQFWKRVLLAECAVAARFDWIALYKIDQIDHAARAAFVDSLPAKLRG